MSIEMIATDPHDAVSVELIAELSAEMRDLYGGDGSGAFSPDDVKVARAVFVIAWVDGQAAGCGALRPVASDANAVEVKRMYVRPAFRGSGLSKQILATLERHARDFGYRAVWLETGIKQPTAIALYERSGFARRACYGSYHDDPESVCFEKYFTTEDTESTESTESTEKR